MSQLQMQYPPPRYWRGLQSVLPALHWKIVYLPRKVRRDIPLCAGWKEWRLPLCADLGVTGVFICNRSFWQLNNTEIAESAKTLLIFGNACRKIGRVQLSNTNQINILHGVPQNSM